MRTKAPGPSALLLLLLAVSTLSCSSAEPNSDRSVDSAEYEFVIDSDHPGGDKTLTAKDVSSTWDPDDGAVWLGTDDFREPLGTLTLVIGGEVDENVFECLVTLSTTDKRVGTSSQINGRLYQSRRAEIENPVIGTNFVEVRDLNWTLQRVLVNPQDEEETIKVTGYFIAVSK